MKVKIRVVDKSIWVSQSGLTRFQTCRRKEKLYSEGWTSKKSKRALRYGSMFHDVLEYVTKYSIRNKRPPTRTTVSQAVMDHVSQWEIDNQKLLKNETIANEMRFDCKLVVEHVTAYIKYYPSDFNGSKKWIALEKKFEIDYKGLKLFGYLDAMYEERRDLYIFETKTKGRVSVDIVELMHTNFQTFYYLHAVFTRTGRYPKAIIYNIAKKFEGKPKVNETPEEFASRFAADLRKRPDFYFRRIRTGIDRAEYQRWVNENLNPLLQDFKSWKEGKSPDYCNTTSCEGGYGSCDYLQICACNNYQDFDQKSKEDKSADMSRRKSKEGGIL